MSRPSPLSVGGDFCAQASGAAQVATGAGELSSCAAEGLKQRRHELTCSEGWSIL